MTEEDENFDDKLRNYFFSNYSYQDILTLLQMEGDVIISLRQLKRHFRRLGLRRRCTNTDSPELISALHLEISGSGSDLGCRAMSHRLLSRHGLSIGRDRILKLQNMMDPDGVTRRKSHCLKRRTYFNRGPNYLIHIDGYDKLKPFGFSIHAAICGFSRRVLWLRVADTNNDPRVIASYFLDYVDEIQGVPRCIRMDAGTENGYVEDIQKAFRWEHMDDASGIKSVIIGKSTYNERIERWWRTLRQMGISYWIELLKDMAFQNVFSTANPLHINCLRFCLMPIMQKELNLIREEWNNHKLRHQATEGCPTGRPNIMYNYPELYGTMDFKFHASQSDIHALMNVCKFPTEDGISEENSARFSLLLEENGRQKPKSVEEALNLLCWILPNL